MNPAHIERAAILAVGTELTSGLTRDTNSGDLARQLADLGVDVRAMMALPDDLAQLTAALEAALGSVDLIVLTGGLGPTPDDLTREAIAAVCEQTPTVDPQLAADLEAMFARRGLPMPEANLKQAWLIPGAMALANPNGTAPGWWVETAGGRLIVALPGPPGEMRPMWRDEVLPRLQGRGLGADRASVTWRLTGIGESALVARIGEPLLRAGNPMVATYARPDAVDVRISAVTDGRVTAAEMIATVERELEPRIAEFRFARGEASWADALGERLAGRRVAVVEIGTAGQVGALLGAAPWFAFGETLAPDQPLAWAHRDLTDYARRVREVASVGCGLAVRARPRGGDT
jgi:nicotinamide-nucleotide amidase